VALNGTIEIAFYFVTNAITVNQKEKVLFIMKIEKY